MPNTTHHRMLTGFVTVIGLTSTAAAGLPEVQQLIPEQIEAYDGFGSGITIDGPFAVIGATSAYNGGAVYVYDTETWTLLREIQGPDGGTFGQALDLDGTTLAVGAPNVWDHGTTLVGKAYLYDILTGEMIVELEHDYTSYNTRFGKSVAIEGDHVAISSNSGKVSIYDRTTGQFRRFITPTDDAQGFGGIVSISDGRIAITQSTTVEVFDLESGDHQLSLAYHNPDTPDTSSSLSSIAFEGDTVVVGSHLWSWGTQYQHHAGAAFVFDAETGTQRFHITPPHITRFGWFGRKVATDGDTVAIASALSGGSINIYDAQTGTMNATLIPGYNSNGSSFASGLVLTDGTALIGASDAHINGTQSGGVYRFDVPCSLADNAMPVGIYDLADIAVFVTDSTDINGDGVFNFEDIDRFIQDFLNPCTPG